MRPRHTILAALLAVVISWRFQHGSHDVLEAQVNLGDSWMEIPGPYELVPNKDGSYSYRVEIPDGASPRLFFRIRRDWGWPNAGPELPEWTDETYTP